MRAGYSKAWKEIRTRILERDGYRCSVCGLREGDRGYRTMGGEWIPVAPEDVSTATATEGVEPRRVTMLVLHKNMKMNDNREENLVAMCSFHAILYQTDQRHTKQGASSVVAGPDTKLPLEGF